MKEKYLVDDAFTQNILIDAGSFLAEHGAIYAVNLDLDFDPLIPQTYWVDGHPLTVFYREIIALDSPSLIKALESRPNARIWLAQALTAINLLLKIRLARTALKTKIQLSSNQRAITLWLQEWRTDLPCALLENGQIVVFHDAKVLKSVDFNLKNSFACQTLSNEPEKSAEQKAYDRSVTLALFINDLAARATNLLSIYNEQHAKQEWKRVEKLRKFIEECGYNVIDGLGESDLARITPKQ